MTTQLTTKARNLIDRPIIASVATVGASGHPQLTPVWVEMNGDELTFNTVRGRSKANNLKRNPSVAVSVVDPDDPYNVVILRGTADVTEEGAEGQIDRLAKKYLGLDTYPKRQPGEVRVSVRVRTDKVVTQPADS